MRISSRVLNNIVNKIKRLFFYICIEFERCHKETLRYTHTHICVYVIRMYISHECVLL